MFSFLNSRWTLPYAVPECCGPLISIFNGLSYPVVKLKERATEQLSHRLRPRASSPVVSIHEPLLPRLALGVAATGNAGPCLVIRAMARSVGNDHILYWHSGTKHFPSSVLFWLLTASCEFGL